MRSVRGPAALCFGYKPTVRVALEDPGWKRRRAQLQHHLQPRLASEGQHLVERVEMVLSAGRLGVGPFNGDSNAVEPEGANRLEVGLARSRSRASGAGYETPIGTNGSGRREAGCADGIAASNRHAVDAGTRRTSRRYLTNPIRVVRVICGFSLIRGTSSPGPPYTLPPPPRLRRDLAEAPAARRRALAGTRDAPLRARDSLPLVRAVHETGL